MRLFLLISLTMVAFAGNSVLGRLALMDGSADAATYSLLRVVSAAVVLLVLVRLAQTKGTNAGADVRSAGGWTAALALFSYVAFFSYSYHALDTGLGALILFSCVQAVMIGWGLWRGDRPGLLEWLGILVAFSGFVFLVSPGLSAPPLVPSVVMAGAGIAWGAYSLMGRGAQNPLLATAGNFTRAVPMALVLSVLSFVAMADATITPFGATMAILSGGVTSGLGYALWYQCLPQLTASRAAIIQLSVPVIATLGGIVFADESLTVRFVVCSALILMGIALSIMAKAKTI
ncbi:MAG: DMT family transporter [Pseudomonadota bacterium]